jgi:hypothetical protein
MHKNNIKQQIIISMAAVTSNKSIQKIFNINKNDQNSYLYIVHIFFSKSLKYRLQKQKIQVKRILNNCKT